MQKLTHRALAGALFLGIGMVAYAQPGYPTAPKKPKPSASASQSPSASPSASATEQPEQTPPPAAPTGPLKMIQSDGSNKSSPIRVTEMNFYDSGYGTKYNSEMRVSGAVQNSSKTATLKKVVVRLQIVDSGNPPQVVQEWKENPGELKPGQIYRINPGVARNTLGTLLKGRMLVDHEEVVEKDAKAGQK